MKVGLDSLRNQHLVVLGATLAISLVWGLDFAASVVLGGGMQAINLWWLERTVRSWATRARQREVGALSQGAALRLVFLLGSVGAVFLLVPIHPIGLTVGLSTAVPTVLWHGLTTAGREA